MTIPEFSLTFCAAGTVKFVYTRSMQSLRALILFSFIFSGCSTVTVPVKKEWVVREERVDEARAWEILREKKDFLALTFEDSTDLEYYSRKWPPGCLDKNQVGLIRSSWGSVVFVSELMMDQSLQHLGLCPGQGEAVPAVMVFLYCRKEKVLYQIRCRSEDCGHHPWESSC